MKESILVPLDGTPLAESVLPCALHYLANDSDRELWVVRAFDPLVGLIPDVSASAVEVVRRQLHGEAAHYLERVRHRHPAVSLNTQLLDGAPTDEIVRAARAHKCRLIIMASHGHSGAVRWLLGSVAEQVLRRTPCPVLLLRPPAPAVCQFRHVLVAVDGSPASFQVANRLAPFLSPGARVSLVHVVDEWTRTHLPAFAQEHSQYLKQLEDRLRAIRVPETETQVELLEGKPAETLCDWAHEQSCDLIALTTHGRTGFRRFWLGSVTAKLARHSACPLLVFPVRCFG